MKESKKLKKEFDKVLNDLKFEIYWLNCQERLEVIRYLLKDGFSEEQIVKFFCQNKKYKKNVFGYHVKRLNEKLKGENHE
jgi:gamma-glutamyl:cysteine ligase YbdK (ATP-grasp superfamily)